MLTLVFALNFLGMVALPIVLAFYFTRKFNLEWKLVWAGALTFIASQVLHIPFLWVLTSLFNSGSIPTPPDSMRTIFTAVMLGLAAGIFEETARFILFKFSLKKAKTWNEGLLVGVGHGGVEALIIGAFGIVTFFSMVLMRNGNLAAFGVPAEAIEATKAQVAEFWATPAYMAILGLVERAFAICLHLALSVMVLYSVAYKKPVWFGAALLWHAFVDAVAVYLLPIVGALAVEGIVGILAVISLWILFTMKNWFVEVEPASAVIEPQG
jgi:uncharacterized membrane protein YhfC